MSIEIKEYGKLSLKKLKEFYAHYHNLQNEKQDVYEINEKKTEIYSSLFKLRHGQFGMKLHGRKVKYLGSESMPVS